MCSVDTDALHHLARSRGLENRPTARVGVSAIANAGPLGPAFVLPDTRREGVAHVAETKAGADKTVAQNRRARHEYSIEDSFEAGIVLTGTEIKSVRAGKVSLAEAYARVENGEAWLVGATISPWETGNRYNHDPKRPRKLLLHRDQILALQTRTKAKGLTLVPLTMYLSGRSLATLELGLGRGKQRYDRRRDIAERDSRREVERAIAEARRGG